VIDRMPKRMKRNTAAKAVNNARVQIDNYLGTCKNIQTLHIWGKSNKFFVPSSTIPHHKYVVHLTPSDSRNSCTCFAHEVLRIRPCKHVLALKQALEN
jgi:predicted nucleic acid-binding Zn finger protein